MAQPALVCLSREQIFERRQPVFDRRRGLVFRRQPIIDRNDPQSGRLAQRARNVRVRRRRADDPAAAMKVDDRAVAADRRGRLMNQESKPATGTLDRRPRIPARDRDATGAFVPGAQRLYGAVEPVEIKRCPRVRGSQSMSRTTSAPRRGPRPAASCSSARHHAPRSSDSRRSSYGRTE